MAEAFALDVTKDVAKGVLKSAIGTLGTLLYEEATLWWTVRENIVFIRDELRSMDAFIQDVLHGGPQNERMKVWLVQVVEVACDAENCIQNFKSRHGCYISRWWTMHNVKSETEELKIRAIEVSKRRNRYIAKIEPKEREYKIESKEPEEEDSTLIRYNHLIADNGLVGIDNKKRRELFDFLRLKTEYRRRILWIHGSPRSGKTALAKMVYRWRHNYDLKIPYSAWVTVSEPFDEIRVFKDILWHFAEGNDTKLMVGDDKQWLEYKLNQRLEEKKGFLLVLDCCKRDDWHKIEEVLPTSGGYVVVVSNEEIRSDSVQSFNTSDLKPKSKSDDNIDLVYKLYEDSSLKLSGSKNSWTNKFSLERFVYHMCWFVSGCRQFYRDHIRMLSVIIIALLFYFWDAIWAILQEDHIFWSIIVIFIPGIIWSNFANIANQLGIRLKYLLRIQLMFLPTDLLVLKCLCAAMAVSSKNSQLLWGLFTLSISLGEKSEEHLYEVMKYCYHQLINESRKACIKDLINLPEGYVIEKRRLIWRWIALGLISEDEGCSKEEGAEKYFNELVSWCVIEPESVSANGKIKSCKVNASLLDVLKEVWNEKSKHGDNYQQANSGPNNQDGNQNGTGNVHENQNQNQNQQSQSISGPNNQGNNQNGNSAMTSFLYFSTTDHNKIIETFRANSKTLSVIELEGCKGLTKDKLRDVLCELTMLKYLSLRNSDVKQLPKNIRKLENLETLVIRQTEISELKDIGKLKLLETLDIRQTPVTKLPNDLVNLRKLKHILVGNSYKPEKNCRRGDSIYSSHVEMPEGIEQMSALQTLAHVSSQKASKVLHAMPLLSQLKKLGIVLVNENLNSSAFCFSLMMLSASLRSLSISYDKDVNGSIKFLDYLWFRHQLLESLNLRGELERLPPWIASHKNLKKLTISKTRLRKEDIKLIGRIPSLLCLKLYAGSVEETVLSFSSDEFAALKLLVVDCYSIRTIQFNQGTLPRLEVLKLVLTSKSGDERTLPGIEYLSALKEISLHGKPSPKLLDQVKKYFEVHPSSEGLMSLNVYNR